MNVKRKISEGVAGWLMYEFHSMRADLFDEKYLVTPISNIISGVYGNRVVAEFTHPILNQHKTWAGRPPQIDFVIKDNNNQNIKIAIESKWYGDTAVNVSDIIWDLIRLELLHKEYGTSCFFVLGGMKKRLNDLFSSKSFNDPKVNGSTRPVLRINQQKKQSLRLDSPSPYRVSMIKNRMIQYQDVSMPSKISTGLPFHYPENCRNADFQVYVWEICSIPAKSRFFPRNNRIYQ